MRLLSRIGHLRFATVGEAARRLARETVPDLVLLDAELPGLSGFQVCAELKADPLLGTTPGVFVTSHHPPGFEISSVNAQRRRRCETESLDEAGRGDV